MPKLTRRLLLTFVFAAVLSGCDGFYSGRPPGQAAGDSETTVVFQKGGISITEDGSPLSIGVTIQNPPQETEAAPSEDTVTVEVLYADAVSATDASDFNLSSNMAVEGGNGYVVGSVSFAPTDSSGTVKSLEVDLKDQTANEDQEDGIFLLQNVQGGATIGAPKKFTASVGAIQIFFTDFSDDNLAPMTAYSVASGEDWGTSSAGGADNVPYASVNGFGANEPSNDWLITSALNFNNFQGETLTFLNAKGFNDSGMRGLKVKVSTDYGGSGDPTNATWIDVSDQVTFSEGNFNFVSSGEVDLSGSQFQDDSVYVAFQYQSTSGSNAAAWEVDNITVKGRPQ